MEMIFTVELKTSHRSSIKLDIFLKITILKFRNIKKYLKINTKIIAY